MPSLGTNLKAKKVISDEPKNIYVVQYLFHCFKQGNTLKLVIIIDV